MKKRKKKGRNKKKEREGMEQKKKRGEYRMENMFP